MFLCGTRLSIDICIAILHGSSLGLKLLSRDLSQRTASLSCIDLRSQGIESKITVIQATSRNSTVHSKTFIELGKSGQGVLSNERDTPIAAR